jgi:DNA-binding NarL/FixJ family response regulator
VRVWFPLTFDDASMENSERKVIRVLVADDHPAFAEGLVKLLERDADFMPIGIARDGAEALLRARDCNPDVVVMDISMPKMNGIEATRRIKAEQPRIAVLALSAFGYHPYVMAALDAGAGGYLLKNAPMEQIINAIRGLYFGETVLNSDIAGKVLRTIAMSRGSQGAGKDLTSSDLELLKLGATGMSNSEIASKLFISERTVQSHFTNIFSKLGVGSRIEAVVKAIKEGWLFPEDLP